jgi:transposase
MYIRRTTAKSRQSGGTYFTHRLVESVRTAQGVRQRTLLNLGVDFPYDQKDWPTLAHRIEQIVRGQGCLFPLDAVLEKAAHHYASRLILAKSRPGVDATASEEGVKAEEPSLDYQTVDMNSLEMSRPRSVGVEHTALGILKKLDLTGKLRDLGLNTAQMNAVIGLVVGRMAAPGSELSTHNWLQEHSGLGELIDWDFNRTSLTQLYQITDLLLKHKESIEEFLFEQEKLMFGIEETITLYDLTNTYFEGECVDNESAKRGHSKEKRTDCPLVTMGLLLDSSGFPKKSKIFAGNVSEPITLAQMVSQLEKETQEGQCVGDKKPNQRHKPVQLVLKTKPTIVMDAGLATEANIIWLTEQGYPYVMVSRKRHRQFSEEDAVTVKDEGRGKVQVQRVVNEKTHEVELYCYSEPREHKDDAILDGFSHRYEAGLERLKAGLSKKTGCRDYGKISERIGRLKERNARAAQNYEIKFTFDETGKKVTDIQWSTKEKQNTAITHPGVYCLRTNQMEWDEKTIWHTYTMLTDLESVFRSLKSELGFRPVFHQKKGRVDSHLFISVMAYHVVHNIRYQLKAIGINDSWQQLREKLSNQYRVTVTMDLQNDQQIHVRKSTRPEPPQQAIYDILHLPYLPGKIEKTIV